MALEDPRKRKLVKIWPVDVSTKHTEGSTEGNSAMNFSKHVTVCVFKLRKEVRPTRSLAILKNVLTQPQ